MNVRAKFQCQSVKFFANTSVKDVEFTAVCADDVPENQRFHRYTPAGSMKISVDNPAVEFVPGKQYYLDFTPVDA